MLQKILVIVFFAAVIFDARENRIPNWLCLFALGSGVILRFYFHGIDGMMSGFMTGILLLMPLWFLWMMGILGAGDVKLMLVAGVYLGRDVFPFLLCAGIATGLLALILMVIRRNFFRRMELFFLYVRGCFLEKKISPYPFDREKDVEEGGIRVSYGFFIGHLLAMGAGYYGGVL